MRTGQAHRTLMGHTAPVTCLQFDQIHIISGSLDKSIRIWDVRTGGVFETLKYDHPVTGLQFDSRKIVTATGENGLKIYNRTSMQHSTLSINGHTRPVERLRYMDRYLVSGGRDFTVKVWSLWEHIYNIDLLKIYLTSGVKVRTRTTAKSSSCISIYDQRNSAPQPTLWKYFFISTDHYRAIIIL